MAEVYEIYSHGQRVIQTKDKVIFEKIKKEYEKDNIPIDTKTKQLLEEVVPMNGEQLRG